MTLIPPWRLKNTLEIQASLDPKAANAKAEDFVDLRFVDELKKSGFIEKLYGKALSSPKLRWRRERFFR